MQLMTEIDLQKPSKILPLIAMDEKAKAHTVLVAKSLKSHQNSPFYILNAYYLQHLSYQQQHDLHLAITCHTKQSHKTNQANTTQTLASRSCGRPLPLGGARAPYSRINQNQATEKCSLDTQVTHLPFS